MCASVSVYVCVLMCVCVWYELESSTHIDACGMNKIVSLHSVASFHYLFICLYSGRDPVPSIHLLDRHPVLSFHSSIRLPAFIHVSEKTERPSKREKERDQDVLSTFNVTSCILFCILLCVTVFLVLQKRYCLQKEVMRSSLPAQC